MRLDRLLRRPCCKGLIKLWEVMEFIPCSWTTIFVSLYEIAVKIIGETFSCSAKETFLFSRKIVVLPQNAKVAWDMEDENKFKGSIGRSGTVAWNRTDGTSSFLDLWHDLACLITVWAPATSNEMVDNPVKLIMERISELEENMRCWIPPRCPHGPGIKMCRRW